MPNTFKLPAIGKPSKLQVHGCGNHCGRLPLRKGQGVLRSVSSGHSPDGYLVSDPWPLICWLKQVGCLSWTPTFCRGVSPATKIIEWEPTAISESPHCHGTRRAPRRSFLSWRDGVSARSHGNVERARVSQPDPLPFQRP